GMAEGLQAAAGQLAQAAANAAAQALAAAKSALGIASPSRVMRDEVGAMISAGIAQGILANAGLIGSAAQRASLAALAAGRGASIGGGLARGGRLTTQVVRSRGTAGGELIARLAQQGKLKITANAIVGGRAR